MYTGKLKALEFHDSIVVWEGLDHNMVLWLKTTSVSTLEKSLDSRNWVSSAATVALDALRSTAMAAALSLRMRPLRRVSVLCWKKEERRSWVSIYWNKNQHTKLILEKKNSPHCSFRHSNPQPFDHKSCAPPTSYSSCENIQSSKRKHLFLCEIDQTCSEHCIGENQLGPELLPTKYCGFVAAHLYADFRDVSTMLCAPTFCQPTTWSPFLTIQGCCWGQQCSSVGWVWGPAHCWVRFESPMQHGIFLPESTFRADSFRMFVQHPCAVACPALMWSFVFDWAQSTN